ncbi:MAG: hypothetical protein KKH04_02650 [Proteobacteria bacterium]|nr:hypothetical protein [Pseudomonadota bacterium]
MSRTQQIGFSQRIRLEWLEQTARLVLAGNEQAAINAGLQELLKDKVSIGGTAERGNREKIITILLKVWLTAPTELDGLRLDGLELLKRLSNQDRIAVHWGMVMAVYPFWASVASQVGRLLKLQGSAAAAHVQRRIREQYGERETVSRAARRVLRSYLDWGVLRATKMKGVYQQGLSHPLHDRKLLGWLAEAFLYSRSNGSASTREIIEHPSLFPFRIAPVTGENLIAVSHRLELHRHGLNDDVIFLKR